MGMKYENCASVRNDGNFLRQAKCVCMYAQSFYFDFFTGRLFVSVADLRFASALLALSTAAAAVSTALLAFPFAAAASTALLALLIASAATAAGVDGLVFDSLDSFFFLGFAAGVAAAGFFLTVVAAEAADPDPGFAATTGFGGNA